MLSDTRNIITAKALRSVLNYDPLTGIFTWRVIGRGHRQHLVAGSRTAGDYVVIYIKPYRYRAHQLAWLYMTGRFPKKRMDHINGIRHDNRFANLRLATALENARNAKAPSTNKSGVRGVCFAKERGGQWLALLKMPDITKRKRFKLREEAIAQRHAWEREFLGEFAPCLRPQ